MQWTYEEPCEILDDDELITLDQAARSTDRSPLTLTARAATQRANSESWLRTMLLGGERHTTMRWVRDYLAAVLPRRLTLDREALITRLPDDPTFWSYVLAHWMAEEGLDGQAACCRLGITQSLGILLLAGLSCPFPGSSHWEALVSFCGRYCQADVACLRDLLLRYKRLPGPAHPALGREEAVALRYGDGAFMARPLVYWQAMHDADDGALSAYLAVPPQRLGLLAYYRRPDPGSVSYQDEVQFLAWQCGCDARQLAALLATVEERNGCYATRQYGPVSSGSCTALNDESPARYRTRSAP